MRQKRVRGGSRWVTHLLHLLSESSEDLVAFGQSALELLKLVHVQRELAEENREDVWSFHISLHWHGTKVLLLVTSTEKKKHFPVGLELARRWAVAGVCTYLLFELCFLFLHQLTLASGFCGILQQLQYHIPVSFTATPHTFMLKTVQDASFQLLWLFDVTVKRECTHKVSLSLLLLLHLFHHLCDSLQLGIHQLLLQLLVLEHFVYVLEDRRTLPFPLGWCAVSSSNVKAF